MICRGSILLRLQTSVTVFVPLRVTSYMTSRLVCARDNDDEKRITKRDRNVSFHQLMVLQLIFPHCTYNNQDR